MKWYEWRDVAGEDHCRMDDDPLTYGRICVICVY